MANKKSKGMRLEFENSRGVLELVMLCLPGGGGCGTESEARALPRQMRQCTIQDQSRNHMEPPASAVAGQGFLSLMGECTPISPAQQLQKLPSFYGESLGWLQTN